MKSLSSVRLHAIAVPLMRWYQKNKRPLPWRETRDPYKIWISEIMLQQTTVNAVIPYYQKWIKQFPDFQSVASASTQKILRAWQGLGYYQRARNLHATAKIIMAQHQGKLPNDIQIIRELPGFGSYTTGSVLSIAYGLRLAIVDANIRRILMRLFQIFDMPKPSYDKKFLPLLTKIIPQNDPGTFNQALMELGALVCRNKNPLCNTCPISRWCAAYDKGTQEIIPSQITKKITTVRAVVAIIERNGKFLIRKRASKGLLADLWEFPGGKIEPGETPLTALRREIREELKCEVKNPAHLMDLQHFYTSFRVQLSAYRCVLDGDPKCSQSRVWVRKKLLKNYPMPSGSAKLIAQLFDENKLLSKT